MLNSTSCSTLRKLSLIIVTTGAFAIFFLISSYYSSDAKAEALSVTYNEHGASIETNDGAIYLGVSCDAYSNAFGNGNWEWGNGGVAVYFQEKSFGFPHLDFKIQNERCRSDQQDKKKLDTTRSTSSGGGLDPEVRERVLDLTQDHIDGLKRKLAALNDERRSLECREVELRCPARRVCDFSKDKKVIIRSFNGEFWFYKSGRIVPLEAIHENKC
ncbi:hypothetical protein [Halomonas rhizosphaerae]|uniref:Uncharacterized protein n=1 Tax=Halomonas rhizosphaerae TaxID=3043296 RepID=A0ABT6V0T0_9GAMM|nr:hypothetical protein [Halomonas rhizosphaerae]MDI5891842.1 hypothetical protein [Halomonas rhizosphaerae]